MELLHLVTYNRKLENVFEEKLAACEVSGMRLQVKLIAEQTSGLQSDFTEEFLHKFALSPSCPSLAEQKRAVCDDSYFASALAAETLLRYGMRLTGVVKTVVTEFPMHCSAFWELVSRVDNTSMISTNECSGKLWITALWTDKRRRYSTNSPHETNQETLICKNDGETSVVKTLE